jgi:predicted lipoprotein with Yx(FWY)xxD motif
MLVAGALAVVGCGSGNSEGGGAHGSSGSTAGKPASTGPAEAGGAVVSAATTPKLGKVLVDSKGLTLYDFHKDKGATSSCYGGCAQVWPSLPSEGAPQAGEGAVASKLGTTKRKDGTVQVTYAGHPLYTYVEDTKPGDTKGNGLSSFGAPWQALKPSGEGAGG